MSVIEADVKMYEKFVEILPSRKMKTILDFFNPELHRQNLIFDYDINSIQFLQEFVATWLAPEFIFHNESVESLKIILHKHIDSFLDLLNQNAEKSDDKDKAHLRFFKKDSDFNAIFKAAEDMYNCHQNFVRTTKKTLQA